MHRISIVLVWLALASAASAQSAPLPSDLQTFRATHGATWGPDQRAAIDAMGRIFAHTTWTGMPFAQVRALLGPEERAETNGGVPCLVYARHDGEQGDIRRLCGANARVDTVERLRTQ